MMRKHLLMTSTLCSLLVATQLASAQDYSSYYLHAAPSEDLIPADIKSLLESQDRDHVFILRQIPGTLASGSVSGTQKNGSKNGAFVRTGNAASTSVIQDGTDNFLFLKNYGSGVAGAAVVNAEQVGVGNNLFLGHLGDGNRSHAQSGNNNVLSFGDNVSNDALRRQVLGTDDALTYQTGQNNTASILSGENSIISSRTTNVTQTGDENTYTVTLSGSPTSQTDNVSQIGDANSVDIVVNILSGSLSYRNDTRQTGNNNSLNADVSSSSMDTASSFVQEGSLNRITTSVSQSGTDFIVKQQGTESSVDISSLDNTQSILEIDTTLIQKGISNTLSIKTAKVIDVVAIEGELFAVLQDGNNNRVNLRLFQITSSSELNQTGDKNSLEVSSTGTPGQVAVVSNQNGNENSARTSFQFETALANYFPVVIEQNGSFNTIGLAFIVDGTNPEIELRQIGNLNEISGNSKISGNSSRISQIGNGNKVTLSDYSLNSTVLEQSGNENESTIIGGASVNTIKQSQISNSITLNQVNGTLLIEQSTSSSSANIQNITGNISVKQTSVPGTIGQNQLTLKPLTLADNTTPDISFALSTLIQNGSEHSIEISFATPNWETIYVSQDGARNSIIAAISSSATSGQSLRLTQDGNDNGINLNPANNGIFEPVQFSSLNLGQAGDRNSLSFSGLGNYQSLSTEQSGSDNHLSFSSELGTWNNVQLQQIGNSNSAEFLAKPKTSGSFNFSQSGDNNQYKFVSSGNLTRFNGLQSGDRNTVDLSLGVTGPVFYREASLTNQQGNDNSISANVTLNGSFFDVTQNGDTNIVSLSGQNPETPLANLTYFDLDQTGNNNQISVQAAYVMDLVSANGNLFAIVQFGDNNRFLAQVYKVDSGNFGTQNGSNNTSTLASNAMVTGNMNQNGSDNAITASIDGADNGVLIPIDIRQLGNSNTLAFAVVTDGTQLSQIMQNGNTNRISVENSQGLYFVDQQGDGSTVMLANIVAEDIDITQQKLSGEMNGHKLSLKPLQTTDMNTPAVRIAMGNILQSGQNNEIDLHLSSGAWQSVAITQSDDSNLAKGSIGSIQSGVLSLIQRGVQNTALMSGPNTSTSWADLTSFVVNAPTALYENTNIDIQQTGDRNILLYTDNIGSLSVAQTGNDSKATIRVSNESADSSKSNLEISQIGSILGAVNSISLNANASQNFRVSQEGIDNTTSVSAISGTVRGDGVVATVSQKGDGNRAQVNAGGSLWGNDGTSAVSQNGNRNNFAFSGLSFGGSVSQQGDDNVTSLSYRSSLLTTTGNPVISQTGNRNSTNLSSTDTSVSSTPANIMQSGDDNVISMTGTSTTSTASHFKISIEQSGNLNSIQSASGYLDNGGLYIKQAGNLNQIDAYIGDPLGTAPGSIIQEGDRNRISGTIVISADKGFVQSGNDNKISSSFTLNGLSGSVGMLSASSQFTGITQSGDRNEIQLSGAYKDENPIVTISQFGNENYIQGNIGLSGVSGDAFIPGLTITQDSR